MVFKFAYFVELAKAISLQGFNAVDFLGQVLQRDYKNTMMMSFHSLGFEISIFCETDYKLSACEVSNPLPWIRGSKERSSQNSRPQDERAKRAKAEEPLVTLDHNLVLEPVRLHVKLLCQDKRGAPI